MAGRRRLRPAVGDVDPAIKEVLQKWKDGKPEVITALPLPDPDDLNAAIPTKEWEIGMDGQPQKPWAHCVVVYGVDVKGGGTFTFISPTIGAHIAVDQLNEAVVTMRMLKGMQVMPMVRLSERPMKTKYGLKSRPHFEVIDWRSPSNGAALPPAPPPLQLPNEAAAPATAEPAPAQPAPVEHVPVAETKPPVGRTPGKISITSGKKSLKSAVFSELENRRPDLKQQPAFDDNLNDLTALNGRKDDDDSNPFL